MACRRSRCLDLLITMEASHRGIVQVSGSLYKCHLLARRCPCNVANPGRSSSANPALLYENLRWYSEASGEGLGQAMYEAIEVDLCGPQSLNSSSSCLPCRRVAASSHTCCFSARPGVCHISCAISCRTTSGPAVAHRVEQIDRFRDCT